MKTPPLIAEIVGASGTGKSTLSETLNGRGQKIRAGITVWGLPLRQLLIGGFLTLPALLVLYMERRGFRRGEIRQIIRLDALYRLLKKEIRAGNAAECRTALFMDEGIVFALAKLHADSSDAGKENGEVMRRWEVDALDRWARILGAIVWMDAPDELLAGRINTRAKDHRMKDKPGGEVREFLARYRASYERIIAELQTRSDRIEVISFRTDRDSPEEMTDEILRYIEARGPFA